MPDYKNQHYLPQFYLRNFGVGNSIAVFNIGTRRHIAQASIAGQCRRPYLYGKDGALETALRSLETRAAGAIRRILTSGCLPDADTEDFYSLVAFIAVQVGRTPQAADVSNAMVAKVGRAVLETPGLLRPELRPHVDKVRLQWTDAVAKSVELSVSTGHLLLDLKAKLLFNVSATPFVTSDSAAVLLNPWCRGWREGGVTGFACSGLQIFLPLSPRLAVLLYDEDVYSVGKHSSDIVRVATPRDAKSVNALQLLVAEENLYYHDESGAADAVDELPLNWHRDRAESVRLHRMRPADDASEAQLLHFFQEQPNVKLDASFIRVRRRQRQVPLALRARTWRRGALAAAEVLGPPRRTAEIPATTPRTWHVVDRE